MYFLKSKLPPIVAIVLTISILLGLYIFYGKQENAQAAEGIPIDPQEMAVKEKIKNFPEQAQKVLMTQAIEKQDVLKEIDQTFNNYKEFTKQGTVYLTKEGELIIGFKDESTDKIKNFKQEIKEKDKNDKIKFKTVQYSMGDLERL